MTNNNKKRLALALDNAAEMILGHVEVGLEPEDVSEKTEEGLDEFRNLQIKSLYLTK